MAAALLDHRGPTRSAPGGASPMTAVADCDHLCFHGPHVRRARTKPGPAHHGRGLHVSPTPMTRSPPHHAIPGGTMRTRTTTAAAISTALLLTLTACGGNDSPAKANTSPATSAKPATPTEVPKTKPATKAPEALAIGTVQKFHSDEDAETQAAGGTVVVLSYQQPVKSVGSASEEAGAKGYVWAALEVKICSTEGEFTTSSQPWTLAYDDGARIEPSSSTYADFPKPEYVEDAPVSLGECSRGKIVYPVPGNQRPARALYSPSDAPTLKWSLSK